jgi:hypothetical protein
MRINEAQQNVAGFRREASNPKTKTLMGRMLRGLIAMAIVLIPGGLGAQAKSAQLGGLPTAIEALRPIKGVAYDPAPSDDPQGENGGKPNGPAANRSFIYYDSDFFNDDFKALWSDDGTGTGNNDLQTMKAAGVNFLHIYNWNAQRNHDAFLNAADDAGIKVMIPISNYTASLTDASCCGINPNPPASGYNAAFNNIKSIFNQIYPNGGVVPHRGAKVWDIMNEFDFENAGPEKVAFIIQSILRLEQERDIPAANRLPIAVPVSFAVRDAENYMNIGIKQPAIFAQAEDLYHQYHPGQRPPGGLLATMALSLAFQQAMTTYAYNNETPVTVPAFPGDFWTTRFIAVVNPFVDGPTTSTYLTDTNVGFQSGFPGKDPWSTLPPLFLGEYGIDRNSSVNVAAQAAFVTRQMNCVFPLALSSSNLPSGYFLGINAFEFSPVCKNKYWNIFGFTGEGKTADPLQGPSCQTLADKLNANCLNPQQTQCANVSVQPSTFAMHSTTSGPQYRVDKLIPFQEWTSFVNGFQQTTVSCQ